ncbi:MAG: hypothetical protein Q4A61_04540 [Porphyromonadaceae bacterium]|nr:hypothetical protein [Porphyromonadaceae bacterium]
MLYYAGLREEEIKNKVGAEWFAHLDTTAIIGNIDFAAFPAQQHLFEQAPLLWAEAKAGRVDVVTMFVQLILTIGRARTFDRMLPPPFLGAFDAEKIAFVPYISVQDVFYLNDFNWLVTPSDHTTREFALLRERIEASLKRNAYIYRYATEGEELRFFIKNNLTKGIEGAKIRIDKNNFLPIYLRWVEAVRPIIDVDWEALKKSGILDSDFYLADLFVDDKDTVGISDDTSIRDNLFVIYQNQGYKIAKESLRQMFDATISIRHIEAYQQFWRRYKRPPLKAYQEYIIERRDLLVPQDIRERKGAYFTPRQWVEKSQEYLALEFGDDWQSEYYIWDCAAGTGNLLAGLNNKYRIWASTLDQADVMVMHERARQGAALLESHVFQFDFLNDDFKPQSEGGKLPDSLYKVIANPNERRKLIIYINPPYAEAGNAKQRSGTGENKGGTATSNKTYERYRPMIGAGIAELFVQFLMRIYHELPLCKIAEFSKLKTLQAPNFRKFRQHFRAKLGQIFLVPADTFDNVKGQFPIGLKIWDTEKEEVFTQFVADVFGKNGLPYPSQPQKSLFAHDNHKKIGSWLSDNKDPESSGIGMMNSGRNDFQNQNLINIQHHIGDSSHALTLTLTLTNIQIGAIFFAVRYCIEADWLNDRDQFLYPNDSWRRDLEFQSDCLTFTLFHTQNRITSTEGVNHWIPFREDEVNAPEAMESHWMTDYISGRLRPTPSDTPDLFSDNPRTYGEAGVDEMQGGKGEAEGSVLQYVTEAETRCQHSSSPRMTARGGLAAPHTPEGVTDPVLQGNATHQPIKFSDEALAVFAAGRALWRYYMAQPNANPNASYYDIRAHFQGFSEKNGKRKMNASSSDPTYTELLGALRSAMQTLAQKIQPKVYQHGYLA